MKTSLVILFCFLLPSLIFSQEKKVALVIGNSNYQNGAPLANPTNDAEDIGEKLKAAGFAVSLHTDLQQTAMKKVIDEFGGKLDKADIGLFFYAGHGVQAKGRNYLIPIDAALKTENDVEYNCVDAGRILAKMEDANTSINIVILDACRNNPFERSWSRNSQGNGLASMNAPSGSLIAYSTAPGKTASDGYYRNSPYTSALLKYISTPNLKIESLFKLVRNAVLDKTNEQQEPWELSSLRGDFYFNHDPNLSYADVSLKDIEPSLAANLTKQDNPDPAQRRSSFEEKKKELAAGIRSIAILPFTNYTGDENTKYLAAGIHDALITELGQLGLVRVTSKTSTLKYADFQNTIKEVATELNVDGVIETSLISIGENLRIQVKLYSAFPQEQMLWSEVYTSEMSDILYLYNQVTKNIADEIQLSLAPEMESALAASRKIDPEAYDAYLKGQYYWEKLDPEAMEMAQEYFMKAIEKEPEWADPYAGLANSWSIFGMFFRTQPKSVTLPKTYKYLNKALELDPNSAQAHYVKAITAVWTEFDWALGEEAFLKSLELNPNDALCRVYYAHLLTILHRQDEAKKQAKLALELDPLKPLVLWLSAGILSNDDEQSAILQLEKALSIDPNFRIAESTISNIRMEAAYRNGDFEKWIEYWEKKVRGRWNEEGIAAVHKAFHEKGNIAAIEEMFNMHEKYGMDCWMSGGLKAERYIILKNYDKAMNCLEEDFEMRDMSMTYISTNVYLYDQLKDNPRYKELLRKMNLSFDE